MFLSLYLKRLFERAKASLKLKNVDSGDVESGFGPILPAEIQIHHLKYERGGWLKRFFSFALSSLEKSSIVKIPFRWTPKWILIFTLVFYTVFLTPDLFPKWLGYKWTEPSDLCSERSAKLERVKAKMESLARLDDGKRFLEQASLALSCFNESARAVWTGPPHRIRFPDQCIPENAKEKTKSIEKCTKSYVKRVCVNRILRINGFTCRSMRIAPVCTTVVVPDPDSVRKVAKVTAGHETRMNQEIRNTAKEFDFVPSTANEKATNFVSRFIRSIDIASTFYTGYSILAILFGTPLVIHKREFKTNAALRLFAIPKNTFMVAVVLILMTYNSLDFVFLNMNIRRLFHNFQNDPCYVDARFSKERLELIGSTCRNISEQRAKLDVILTRMSKVVYDSELCEVCGVGNIQPHEDNLLVQNLKTELGKYTKGTAKGYVYPGVCNTTKLDEETATPPDSGISFVRAFFMSGIIAQIFLKGILTNFTVDTFANYIEPMITHSGQIDTFHAQDELWNAKEGSKETETAIGARKLAKDRHMFGFVTGCILMGWEICVIGYSLYESRRKGSQLLNETVFHEEVIQELNHTCARGILTSQHNR